MEIKAACLEMHFTCHSAYVSAGPFIKKTGNAAMSRHV